MPKFVMANRRSGLFTRTAKLSSRASADGLVRRLDAEADIIGDLNPPDETARRVVVFAADAADGRRMIRTAPDDVIIEPEILHYVGQTLRPPDLTAMNAVIRNSPPAPPTPLGATTTLSIRVTGSGTPVVGALVELFLTSPLGAPQKQLLTTDGNGTASFVFGVGLTAFAAAIVPAGGFWPRVVRGLQLANPVDLPPLPVTGPLGWWHRLHGVVGYDETRGAGIRVGVVDTGCGPNDLLKHASISGSFLNGNHDPQGGADVDAHGTHVCGIIGAKPRRKGEYSGIAPGVDLSVARVFADADSGANQGDIANAIDHLSRTESADLINLSLGATSPSQISHDAILDALERGTLCICAAGNSAATVEYPAAFPECVSVSAVGLQGWAPPGTISASRYPVELSRHGFDNYFLANFSCFGKGLDLAGAGVGVVATIPSRPGLRNPFGAMDGTSMASPAACAALAATLAASPAYTSLGRDSTRAQMARQILQQACRSIGLSTSYVGDGVPVAP